MDFEVRVVFRTRFSQSTGNMKALNVNLYAFLCVFRVLWETW